MQRIPAATRGRQIERYKKLPLRGQKDSLSQVFPHP
jgi:hypothetical protein